MEALASFHEPFGGIHDVGILTQNRLETPKVVRQ